MQTLINKSCTAGELSPDALTGPTVRLWPYAPGVYGRDCLYRIWRLIEDEDCAARCFWDQAILPATAGDLANFIKAFEGVSNRLLLMVEVLNGSRLVGCCWFTEIQVGHQAFGSIFMVKTARGPMAEEAARLAIGYIFTLADLEQLWGLTPWPEAAAFVQRCCNSPGRGFGAP